MSISLRKLNRSVSGNIAMFGFIFILASFMAFPLVYVVNNAFKPIDELFVYPPRFFVSNPTMSNFEDLFKILNNSMMPFSRYFFNTIFITVVGTVGQVILASLCAYSLSKIPFRGAKLVFKIIVLSLMFSPVVTSIPNYIVMSKLNLIDNMFSAILPAMQSSLGLYLIKQFMDTVPDSLMEAARIDGASEFRIFFRIIMPAIKPAWLTLSILSIQGLWNNVSPFVYSEELKTLPSALIQMVSSGISRVGVSSAVGLLMIIIPIVSFVLVQSNIVETMSSSGMKE